MQWERQSLDVVWSSGCFPNKFERVFSTLDVKMEEEQRVEETWSLFLYAAFNKVLWFHQYWTLIVISADVDKQAFGSRRLLKRCFKKYARTLCSRDHLIHIFTNSTVIVFTINVQCLCFHLCTVELCVVKTTFLPCNLQNHCLLPVHYRVNIITLSKILWASCNVCNENQIAWCPLPGPIVLYLAMLFYNFT
jgi:hypothetical protein